MEIVYAIALPAILVYVAHFLFISNYTGRWTVALFERQYAHGIYRYRVLGRWAVLWLTGVNSTLPFFSERTVYNVGEHFTQFSPPLYWAYFQVNLAFFVGSCAIWWIGLKRRLRTAAEWPNPYLVLLLAAVLGMSVVVPYDMMAYFFLSATIVAYHIRVGVALPALAVLTVLGTLTRETQILAIAYAGSVIAWQGISRAGLLKFASITGAFGGTYLALRLVYGVNEATFRSVELAANLTNGHKIVGLGAMVVLTVLVIDSVPWPEWHSLTPVVIPLVLMAPYLVIILLFGKIDELRLIVPVEVVLAFYGAWAYAEGSSDPVDLGG